MSSTFISLLAITAILALLWITSGLMTSLVFGGGCISGALLMLFMSLDMWQDRKKYEE